MDVQVESPGGLARRLQVTIPADRVSKEMNDRLKNIAGRVKVRGFRPGKAPMKVVEMQYGESVRQDVIGELLHKTWPEALEQTKIQPAAVPQFEVTSEKIGEPLIYVANFDVLPEIVLDHLDDLKVKRPVVEVTEADVDKLVGNLRKARRNVVKVEREARSGDVVVIDFTGKLDGEAFQGGEGKAVEVEIGAQQFLPDLENALIGHVAGDEFTADVNFPADYRVEKLQGKTTQFFTKLVEVREATLPEMDDTFLQGHGITEGGVEAFRAKCRAALEGERDKATRAYMKRELLNELIATHPLAEVPKGHVEKEILRMREEASARFGLNQADKKPPPEQMLQMLPDILFEGAAQRRVALGLLMSQAVKIKNIQIEPSQMDKALNDIAADYDQPEQVRQHYVSRPELLDGVRSLVLEEQVVEALMAHAKTTDLEMSLEDLLKSQSQAAA